MIIQQLFHSYKGKKLSEAHSNIGITDAMYKEFKGCMENALKEMNMNPQTIKDILISFDHFKKEIVPNWIGRRLNCKWEYHL